MSAINDQLKVLIHDAKGVCDFKHQRFEEQFGPDNPELRNILQHYKDTFSAFRNPELWLFRIPFSGQKLLMLIDKVDLLPPDDLPGYKKATDNLLDYLDNELLNAALDRLRNATASDFNALAMDWVLKIISEVEVAEHTFEGLTEDASYVELRPKEIFLTKNYQTSLQNNDLQTTNEDLNLLARVHKGLFNADVIDDFLFFYSKYVNFMEIKMSAVV
ncbi:MAG: hypothetical protein KDC44_10155 [Phaeodactylibacter sp.]|nr:hypothetical protein [Phaeodactylibacter sp.]